jgi:diguanylate cyclase (GGDEF)-like protein
VFSVGRLLSARVRPPRELLTRVRWAFLLVAYFNAGLSLVLIAASDAEMPVRVAGLCATAFLCWRWQRGYKRGHFDVPSELIAGGALIVLGFGAGDPIRSGMVVYMSLFLQALFGTRRRVALATAIHLSAYAVAVALSPTLARLEIWSPEVLMTPPGVAMVAVMFVLGSSLGRHERAAARERALARFGSALVASTDRQSVYAAAMKGAQALLAPHAVAQVTLTIGSEERVQVVATDGEGPSRFTGQVFELAHLPQLRDALLAGHGFELDPVLVRALGAVPEARRQVPIAFVSPLLVHEAMRGSLTVITPTSLPEECKDGLQALTTEVALALEACGLREQLVHQAFHDPLTGLANRALLADRAQHALARSARRGETTAGLLLDLDGLKTVNDSLGHAAGDEVLAEVANRLRSTLRETDTAARLGGDEFAVLLEDLENPLTQACAIAQRILDVLLAPVLLGPREVFVSASIGIALSSGTTAFDELLSQADTAMYAAKRNGKARYSVFEPTLHGDAVRRLELETDLRRAIEAGQFVLHYQPIVELAGAQPVGLEALIRWHHPTRGLVAPDQFIPLAEETGLIVPLGRWVLRQACRQVSQLRTDFPSLRPLNVSVNVAARQILEAGFVDDVRSALSDSGLPADALILELTEHALLQRSNATLARLQELRGLGVRLALDDFGTGYSSLAYLRDLPFDRVKIDRSFIDGIERTSQQAALVHAIVSLSRALGLETVGEGIELAAQANQLALLGCDLAQGYHFSKPVDVETIARLLGAEVRAQAA